MTGPQQLSIMLIEPPFYRLYKASYSLDRYPLSLGYLAAAITGNIGWDVRVYNADFSPQSEPVSVSYMAGAGFATYLHNLEDHSGAVWREIKDKIAACRPSVVGISAKSQNWVSAGVVAALAKQVSPDITVVVGGPHSSMVGAAALDCPDIDIAVRGEGEVTVVGLLKALQAGGDLAAVNGLVYRRDGDIVETPPREFIADLDALRFPHEVAPAVLEDYDKYPLTAFKCIFAVRGCPYNCFFCGSRSVWSRKVRFRSADNVAREIAGLQKLGLQSVHFDDDTFGVSKAYIRELCRAIREHCPGLKWSCEFHVKLVDDATIALVKQAGCFSIQVGIESGSNEMLRKMRKHITIEEALAACRIIRKHGISLQAFFMVGFPEETEETLRATETAMKKARCNVLTYSIFTPYPGTEAFGFCREQGLIDAGYNTSLYNHQSPANCFCLNIAPERFRFLVARIERMVDRKNRANKIKRLLSLGELWRVRELGLAESLRRGMKILLGR